MTRTTYETIQGVLSYVVLLSLAVALTFTIDYHNLLGANDLTTWGKQFMPPFFNTAWAIFALALVAKVWGSWIHNRFWLKLELAKKLHATADKLDPRRH